MTNPTTYHRPKTLTEAIVLSQQPDSLVLAGGVLTLPDVSLPYDTIIDVQDVPELQQNEQGGGGASFGAAISLQTVLDWPDLPDALRRALTRTIPPNLRARISLGESLRFWREPILREWITVLMAHDIGIEYVKDDSERTWDNIVGLSASGALDQRFITSIHIPTLSEGETLGAAYIASTPDALAIVNAAAFIYIDPYGRVESEFIYVSGASVEPIIQIRLSDLIPNPFDEANIASVVQAVMPQINPPGTENADERREQVREVVQRALMECLEQLQ